MSKLSEFLKGKKEENVTFERGKIARAKRDVLAKRLAKKAKIKEPFALATYMIKKGVKVKDHEIEREFAEQKAQAKKKK